MEKFISVIIPVHNGGAFIGKCLDAAFASRYDDFEVIVVDDGSTDDSAGIVKRYPCTLVSLKEQQGASAARNQGAAASRGDVLFFVDADCLLRQDTLSLVNTAVAAHPGAIIGGTYTPLPYDPDFFSTFQSLFIHYFETKNPEPDYIATHAMVMDADAFKKNIGFREGGLPILEDVEFSHRLRRSGVRLIMRPEILVQHVFNFTLKRSLKNAFRKSTYWTMYSLQNRDLLSDSGTASRELKVNAILFFWTVVFGILFLLTGQVVYPAIGAALYAVNILFNRGLIRLFFLEKGMLFAVLATLYYTMLYPVPVALGAAGGMLKSIRFGSRRL